MITDGNLRDVAKVVALNFPAFSASRRPIDYRGRMQIAAAQQPVVIGGVSIAPNDLVCVDDDGVAVAPAAVAEEVMAAARARANAESTVLAELLAGATLREVWTRHGI
jgi:regulator of RNase E activity RraA